MDARRLCALAAVVAMAASPGVSRGEAGSGKKRRPLPSEYGRVVLGPSEGAGKLGPVTFDHWLHRAKFTCRLCHVDVGFAMKAGATPITAADNAAGYYCGACHDGKRVVEGQRVFDACRKEPAHDACARCHEGKATRRGVDFGTFTRALPRGRFGNGVDWEKAEELHLVKPVDQLEGVSIRRPAMTAQKDFALTPDLAWMPEIVFSHQKHTVWSGCEGCHPEIFVGVKRGTTKYSMVDIFEGRYCGVCHQSVAFPTLDCQRCHTRPVQ